MERAILGLVIGGDLERYRNTGRNSNIRAFEIGPDSISIEFSDGATYLYTSESTGSTHIAEMQRLARRGCGLNSYINRVVRKRYARRLA